MSQRILFVIKSLFPAGDAYQLHLLAGELAMRHWDIHIAVTDPSVSCSLKLPSAVKVHTPRPAERGRLAKTGWLSHLTRKLRPGIVHSWDFDSAILSHLAALGVRTRRISTLLEIPPSRELWFRQASQALLKRTEFVVCHERISRFISQSYPATEAKPIRVIPNAIVPRTFDRVSARQRLLQGLGIDNPDALIVSTVAELSPRTRIKDQVWAAALLECVDYDIHLLVFGVGQQERRLKQYAQQTRAGEYVHCLHQAELVEEAMVASQAYWHSHLTRPLPSELMIAMANGVPTVSVLGEGTDSLVRHQQTSLATNYGARDEFARWTKYIVEQETSAQQLVEQARSYVENRFPVACLTEPYLDLYQ